MAHPGKRMLKNKLKTFLSENAVDACVVNAENVAAGLGINYSSAKDLFSFGADRIYDVLTELNKFPANLGQSAQAIFINFGAESLPYCIKCAAQLRAAGISTLVYPDAAKMKKQMDYANKNHIPFVVFVGETEIAANTLTVKNMTSGEQKTVTMEELLEMLRA